MVSKEQEDNQDDKLRIALRTIRQDTSLYPTSFGQNEEKSTKQVLFKKLFGYKARHGETKNINGIETHIPGYYEKYPELSVFRINKILAKHIINLANSTILMHQESLLQGDLRKASAA